MVDFLRNSIYACYGLTVVRLYLGWAWLKAGWEKISEGNFDASGFLNGAVKKAGGDHPAVQGWWADFINSIALPNVDLFNLLVPWGECLVGIGLILGSFTIVAAFMGMVMNFSYMFSGSTSTNPFMVLMGIFILVAGLNAGKIGFDRWFVPFLRQYLFKKDEQSTLPQSA